MAKRASEWIPHNILAAAEKAGLSLPLWYVGRNNGHDGRARKKTLADLASEARERESQLGGTESAESKDLGQQPKEGNPQ